MNGSSGVSLQVQDLRCEYMENPLGIGVVSPRLSWKLVSQQRGVVQSAYQIRVADAHGELWESGKMRSDQSLHVPYDGPALQSSQRCTWRVRVWDGADSPSDWSEEASWEMGLLHASDWHAQWITPAWEEDPTAFKPSPYLRTAFSVDGKIASARVYITAHGLYELSLNGQRVGDAYFTPGYTSYHRRLQYQVYDITPMLLQGENAVGVILGDGWYRGQISLASLRNAYGDRLGLLLQLHLRYVGGREQLVISNEQWKATTGPIVKSDWKDGEVYDARLEMPGWDQPGFAAQNWRGVSVVQQTKDHLVATISPGVRCIEEVTPVAIITTPNGETVVDMGQNFAGVVRLSVQGPAGTTILLQHGEALDKQGNFTMENLQTSKLLPLLQEVHYTLKGGEEEVYIPHFTFHGFRYVRVRGFPGRAELRHFTGLVLSSVLPQTGTFQCSNPLVNQLHHNIAWSQRSNFLDIPTDCPTRERAGWTGDAQIFARTGSFLVETASFFTKWLKDLAVEQHTDGKVLNTVPNCLSEPIQKSGFFRFLEGSAGFADAAVMVPWTLYQCYDDRRVLEEQYPSMKAWVEYMRKNAKETHWTKRLNPLYWVSRTRRARALSIWDTNFHFGEWLEPGEGSPLKTILGIVKRLLFSDPLVATSYFAHSTQLLAETAQVLGKDEDALEYQTLYSQIRAAYPAEFIGRNGQIRPEKQASYVRALAFDLLPAALQKAAAQHLVALVRKADTHLGTGFLSTSFLCHVLSAHGQLDMAYDLLKQETTPSWLFAVKKGATTIWESWEGMEEDGTPHLSLNHYAYGAIGSWLYQVVAGIEIGSPGYKHIIFQPQPGGGLTHAQATYRSLYGEIASQWHLHDGMFTLTVTVPPNTSATVRLPAGSGKGVTESGHELSIGEGIKKVRREGSTTLVEVGAGTYTFACAWQTALSADA